MKYFLIIAIFLTGCMSQKKAYTIVNEDTALDTKEQQIIRQKCMALFPCITGVPVDVSRYIDSSEYNATVNGLVEMIDTLLAQYGRQGEIGFIDTNDIVSMDSLRIIRNFIKTYRPKPIKEYIKKEVQVRDTRIEDELRAQKNACNTLLAKAEQERDDAKAKAEKSKSQRGWFFGFSLLAVIISFIVGRFIKR